MFRSIVLAFAVCALGAAPAWAGAVQANPYVMGSGTVSVANGAALCSASAANGAVTTCSPQLFANTVVLTATPFEKGDWVFVGWNVCPEPSGQQCVLRATTNPVQPWPVMPIFQDAKAPVFTPTVTLSTTQDRTATVRFGSEPLSAAQCKLDGTATACTSLSSHVMTLPEGEHNFSVSGTDIAGNTSSFSPAVKFRIIDTALVNGPADFSSDRNPRFEFTSVTGSAFECRLDSAPSTDCGAKGADGRAGKAYSNLADGTHTFRVWAKDGSTLDQVPVARTWIVDTTAPVATLGATGPGEGALQAVNKESFTFSANENSSFQCRFDSAEFAQCEAGIVLENLAAGAHRFEVRAIDLAGNVGAVAARNWAVAGAQNPLVIREVVTTERLVFTIAFFATAKKKTTKFASLQVKNVLKGATVTVTCKGKGCPSGLKGKGYTKANVSGTVSLDKFIKKSLKAGDKITVVVSKAGAITTRKVLTVRAGKRPIVR
jgi:hypothetical protein